MRKKTIGIIALVIIILGIICIAATSSDTTQQETVNVTNLNVASEGYGLYTVTCDLTPKQNYSYLEMEVIFYDSNDAVIGKSPLAWNINSPAKDQLIKVSGTATTNSQNTKPARAEVFIFDSVSTDDPSQAIFSQNVTMK